MNVRLLSLLSSFVLSLCLGISAAGQANQAPVASPDTLTVHGSCSNPLSSCPNVLLNDSDPNVGDTLHTTPQANVRIGNIGEFSIGPTGQASFSVFTTGITSGGGSVTYEVCDSGVPALCTTSTITISVFNSPPTVSSETYTVHGTFSTPDLGQYSGVLANDSDPEGDLMSVHFICDPTYIQCDGRLVGTTLGSALLSEDGRVSFSASSLVGSVTIYYRVTDSLGSASISSVTFDVVNSAPIPGTDFIDVYDGTYSSPFGHSVLNNDSDPDGDNPLSTGWIGVGGAQYPEGMMTMNEQGRVNFVAYGDFAGTIVFPYTLKDSLGLASSGTIVFKVHPRDKAADAGRTCSALGQPVSVANGNMWLEQTDYSLPGLGERIEIKRFYNSVIQSNGLFGFGWSTKYDETLVAYGDKMLRLNMADGRAVYFARPNTTSPFINDKSGDEGQIVKNADNSYTLTFKDGRIHKFSSTGRLLWQEDRNGNRTTLNYTGGLLTSITDPGGRTLTFTYTNGNISEISDSLGSVALYEYDAGTTRLKTVTYNDGSKFKFEYDLTTAAGKWLLTTVKDAQDNILETHAYDSTGRALTSEIHGGKEKYTFNYSNWNASVPYTIVTSRKQPTDPLITTKYYFNSAIGRSVVTKIEGICSCGGAGSEVTEFTYDEKLNLTRKTDALSNQTLYGYDAAGNLVAKTDQFGTEKYTYDSFGQLLTYKDRVDSQATNVNTAVLTYNSFGNLLTFTDALGKVTSLEYPATNNKGLPKWITDARNNTTNLKWFPSGLLEEVEDPYAKKTKFTYDGRSRTKTVTNALNHVTTYNYFDDTQRKVETIYPNLDKITYKYDIRRLLESVTDERGKITGYEFDPQYRLKKITDPLGHFKEFGYDDMSNMTSYKDALGNITNYEYDDFSRMKKVVHPAAVSGGTRLDEEFEYDKLGRIKKYTDTADRITLYGYDDATRTNTVTNAENEVTTVKYNQRFQTTEVKDAINQTYTFSYDPLGRLLSQTRAGGTMNFEYDNVGNRKKRTDYMGRVTNYTYDNLNRLKKIEYEPGTGNAVDKQKSEYDYDDISRLISAVNEVGTVSFNYDNRGRVINTTDVFGKVIAYEYERTPTVNQKRLKLDGANYAFYNFDDAGRLSNIVNSSDSTTTTFGYDNEDKVTSRVFPNGVTTTYEYYNNDLLKRLKDATTSATLFDRQYTYNSANQINQITDLPQTRTFGYDNLDRLLSANSTLSGANETYTFDDVGNRTSSHLSATYGYQSGKFNQLSSTSTATYGFDENGNTRTKSEGSNFWSYNWDYENRMVEASTRKQKVRYRYDALGRRVQRFRPGWEENTKFTHDGLDVLVDNDNGTLTKYLNGPGIDNKLRVQTGSTVNYFLSDHLGSTNGLTDSVGSLTSSASYDSFGNKTGNLATRYQFTGREYDGFTGQDFYRARFYDAGLGRFTSEDPIGFAGGDVNLYGYVRNQPLVFTDSLGLDPEWDQQRWRAEQDLLNALAPAIRFGMGYGDNTLFGLPKYLRQWQGIDDPSLPCYTSYQAGEWTGVAVQVALGVAAGLRAAGGKAAGSEFSHWIPKRHGGPRSILNGNYVPIAEHALTDPFRYRFMPRVWKASNPMLPPGLQQWHRIPRVYKGGAAGAGAAATSSYLNNSDCECK